MIGPESVTRIAVTRAPGGGRVSARVSAAGPVERPVIRPMLVRADAQGASVSLVPEGALLLAGDAVRIEVHVGPGVCLELMEPAGTVAYPMHGSQARWDVHVELGPDATLIWAGEPFVVAEGASVIRRTQVSMQRGARLALREVVVLGRHDEGAGSLEQDLDVVGPEGASVLRETLHLGPGASRLLTGGLRAITTVLLVGARLPDSGDGTHLDLEAEGTMVRGLAQACHRAMVAASWHSARALARAPERAIAAR